MSAFARRQAWCGLALWCVLALPPARHLLESSILLHMLVQIPLLALAGWWLAALLPGRFIRGVSAWNRGGVSGIVLVSVAALMWMLPRSMDAALDVGWVEAAKFASLPLLIGLPLALSWPHAGFVVRGVYLVEVIATAFRMGWLYLSSPQRLCSNYLLDDQQRLGKAILAIGVAICLVLAWKLMCGRVGMDGAARHRDGKGA